MINWKIFKREWSWHNWGIILEFSWKFWGKPRETSVRIKGVSPEIRIKHLQDTSLERCCYTNLIFGPSRWSDIKYSWMPPCVNQAFINMAVWLPIRRCPSIFIHAAMREHCTLDNYIFFHMEKFTTVIPLSLLISYEVSYTIVCLSISLYLPLQRDPISNLSSCTQVNDRYNYFYLQMGQAHS
jgi:hypothetical protein